jgi:hypothetical protein
MRTVKHLPLSGPIAPHSRAAVYRMYLSGNGNIFEETSTLIKIRYIRLKILI